MIASQDTLRHHVTSSSQPGCAAKLLRWLRAGTQQVCVAAHGCDARATAFDPPSPSSRGRGYALSSNQLDDPGYHKLPFRFETGIGLFAKRQPRPFPPPFHSPPSASFSDPLSTHHQSRDRRAFVDGELIRGKTNGDDAVYASDHFICANDGVGAWATRPRGHAGLWSRLMLHYWAIAVDQDIAAALSDSAHEPNPIDTLQTAFEKTQLATGAHNWQGTTTVCGAQLYTRRTSGTSSDGLLPLLYVTNLGDCQVMVLRPQEKKVVYKTKEQWHWFDCPRQLGTNSPDTPKDNAVMDTVDLEVGDVVLAMSDGVIDNLWEHEITKCIFESIEDWESDKGAKGHFDRSGGRGGGMKAAAHELVAAATKVAMDPFAESPFMEHAIEEGLASEGGKLDDISVVAALCPVISMRGKRSKQYRKLMEQFSMTFGFREPYQVLVDAEMVRDSCRFKMELDPALQRTVHGKVKGMITQCEIRKLYAQKSEPGVNEAIEVAKTLERRRCGHHPDQYPEPLSTRECLLSVVDPKSSGQNKHRYVVASQSQEVRRTLREVRGVPLIYIKRSVMILEPMADESVQVRAREEKSKFRAELKKNLGKRKREDNDEKDDESDEEGKKEAVAPAAPILGKGDAIASSKEKKRKGHGPKGPNPLSMKRKKTQQDGAPSKKPSTDAVTPADGPGKRKRRKKTKSITDTAGDASSAAPIPVAEES
ncbi:rRNA-processing UTP23 [Paramyrothecium foliicola]|nr:rRNA-processing UTP23 [Paramyrothecium foliicola]